MSLLVCVLAFVLSLVGCGNAKTSLEYDQATLEKVADTVINSFAQMGDADFKQFTEGPDLQVDLTLMQSGLPVQRAAFVSMIEAWKAGTKECGTYAEHGDYAIEASSKEITMTTNAKFDKRDAEIKFIFDEKLNIKNMTVSGEYTKGEILKKAGLNTLLGMGTVFSVLIFIAFIISLFKYIPNIQEKFSKKSKELIVATAISETPIDSEDMTEDGELVAVITAAIAASTEMPADGFVVRKIKRKTSNKWN